MFTSIMIPFFYLSYGFVFIANSHSILFTLFYIVGFLAILVLSLNFFRKLFIRRYLKEYYSDATIQITPNKLAIDINNHKAKNCRSYIIHFDDIESIGYSKCLSYAWNGGYAREGYEGKGLVIKTKQQKSIILKIEKPQTYLKMEKGIQDYDYFTKDFLLSMNQYNKTNNIHIKITNPIVWKPVLRTICFAFSLIFSLMVSLFAGGYLGILVGTQIFRISIS